MTAIAATALALAFGCEQMGGEQEAEPIEEEQQEEQALQEQQVEQQEEQARVEPEQGQQPQTQFNQEPGVGLEEEEPIAQGPDARMRQQQGQMGQQQMGQQGQMGQQQQLGQAQMPGQVVTMPSERNFNQTISQLQRQMRQNDLELVGQIRYDEQARQRLMRQQGQEGQDQQALQGQEAQGEIGDVRLLVFRHPNAEMMSIEQQGAEVLLDAPRTVLVYERGDDVIVAYRAPREMAAIGTEEPTSELLARVVRNATHTAPQPTAALETEGEPIARGELGEPVEGELEVGVEDERQARAGGQQGEQAQN
ncbi:MAG: hypothetical protein M5U28_34210 [Sandaracinaceae bacterium]|nr:hypothetical protein [Sandaracinaceae bacterium]